MLDHLHVCYMEVKHGVQEKMKQLFLSKAQRSMVRVMCHVKLVDKRNTEKLMLGLKKAADKLARANGVRWYGHVLKIFDEGNGT